MAGTQRISYVAYEDMDEAMQAELRRCAEIGTPRPESSAVRAHAPNAFWAFADAWEKLFRSGVVSHEIKELCRIFVSKSVQCEYCGNQRSEQARQNGLREGAVDELLNFETSPQFTDRERAALRYAEAITWRLELDDAAWAGLHEFFTEAELTELGCFIALTMGQQSWIRLLNIGHQQVLAGTTAGLRE